MHKSGALGLYGVMLSWFASIYLYSRWLVQVTHQSYFDPLSQQSPSMNKWQGVSGTTEQLDAEHYWLTHRLNLCLTSLSCIYDNWFKEETLNSEMGTLSAHSFWCHQQQTDKMFMSNAENVSSRNLLFPHIFSSLEKYKKTAFFKLTVDFLKKSCFLLQDEFNLAVQHIGLLCIPVLASKCSCTWRKSEGATTCVVVCGHTYDKVRSCYFVMILVS